MDEFVRHNHDNDLWRFYNRMRSASRTKGKDRYKTQNGLFPILGPPGAYKVKHAEGLEIQMIKYTYKYLSKCEVNAKLS